MFDRHRPAPHGHVARGRRPRVAGVVQIAAGLFLIALMGTVTWRMAPMLMTAPATVPDGSHFNAPQLVGRLVLGLFASVLLFGGIAIVTGARQVANGRPPWRGTYALLAAAALIVVLARLTVFAVNQAQR